MDGYEATRAIRAVEMELAPTDTSFTKGDPANKMQEFPKETPKLLSGLPKGVPIIAMTANVFREDIE